LVPTDPFPLLKNVMTNCPFCRNRFIPGNPFRFSDYIPTALMICYCGLIPLGILWLVTRRGPRFDPEDDA
jgi:hypothetical protein